MASADASRDPQRGSTSIDVLPLSARTADPAGFQLSPVQEAMYFHAVASDAPDLYIVQQVLRISGPLDTDRFEDAWTAVVARHEALRTVFHWQPGETPRQVVRAELPFDFDVVALSELEAESTEVLAAEQRSRRFDLQDGPTMRLLLVALGPNDWQLIWTQHHLVQDGWSAGIVLRQVFEVYESGSAPSDADTPQFRSYVDWLQSRSVDDDREFWSRELDGLAQPTRMLPSSDEPGGYSRSDRTLDADLSRRLRDFAKDERLTLNTVLVGAMALLVARSTGSDDVALGVVASGRPPQLADMDVTVGMFINTTILRLPVPADGAVVTWLAEVQRRQAAVLEHEHVALPQLQQWSPLGTGTALSDVLFAYWGFGGSGSSPSGALTYETVGGYGRTSFPFSVTVESSEPLRVGLDHDAADLSRDDAQRFLHQLELLLAGIVDNRHNQLAEITTLSEDDLALIHDVNRTEAEIPHATILEGFAAQVAQRPDAPAVLSDGVALTFAELDQISNAVAESLVSAGVADRAVGVYLPRSSGLIAALLACLKAGCAFVPIDRHLPAARVQWILEDSGAALVISTDELTRNLAGELPPVMTIDADRPADRASPGDADSWKQTAVDPATPAYTMYTSGSTGTPKGVVVSHRSLINYAWWAAGQYGEHQPTSFPFYTSVGFDLTITSVFVPLLTGGSVVVYADDDPRALTVRDVFEEDAVDVVKLTPSHLAVLEDRHLAAQRIRALVVGGEDLKTSVALRAVECSNGDITVYNEYGPTEATVGCMIHRFDRGVDTATSVPIGKPIANTRLFILDPTGAPAAIGVPGEIHVAGAGVALEYLGRPDLTTERFVLAPDFSGLMYRTGDIGSWMPDGRIEYHGRNDDQVKVRGVRIEPGEIETALERHQAVGGAAVAVREPRPGDIRLVAYYVGNEQVPANLTELREHLARELPDAMVPRHLVRLEALPLTTNGKLDRSALPDAIGEVTTTASFVAPRNRAEEVVAAMAAELLGVDKVSVGDNFFDLGGHSILAMQMITRLHTEAGVRISPRVVLLNPLEQVARQLGDLGDAAAPTVAPKPDAAAGHEPRRRTTSAFFFGSGDEPLFGMASLPDQPTSRGVVLCAPIGWEYMRTHWAMRQVSRSLVDAGLAVLRFDYFATGDSFGTSGDGTIERWIDDITTSVREVCSVADVQRVTLMGVRLGATLAAAAAAGGAEVEGLVLWDPILEGADHLSQLERMHAQMLASRQGGSAPIGTIGNELLGFPYPAQLRAELSSLSLADLRWPQPTTILTSGDLTEFQHLTERPDVDLERVSDASNWDDLASTYAALLPRTVPARIASIMGHME